jgi:hypothetical protein
MAASGRPVVWLYAGCLNAYPITYYVTTTQPRFYHAVTPLLVLCASFALIDSADRIALRLGLARASGIPKRPKCIVASETGTSLGRTPPSANDQAPVW